MSMQRNEILKLEATTENRATIQIRKPKYLPCGTSPLQLWVPKWTPQSNSRRPSYRSLSQNQHLTNTSLLISTTKLDLTTNRMQHNEQNPRRDAMPTNLESDDSDSDVTVQVNPEQYCTLFLHIPCTTDLIWTRSILPSLYQWYWNNL